MSSAFDQIEKFEMTVGLPKGFYHSLLKESDWGFIIKLHSLFEASATHILNLRIGDGCLEEALSYIDFSHSKYGKTKLLRKLGALNANQAKFLQWLSEIRNKMVHQVENVLFDLKNFVDSLDNNQKNGFCNKIGYSSGDEIPIANTKVPRNQFILENPKLSIWLTASDVLACICLEEEFVELDKQKNELTNREINFVRRIFNLSPLIEEVNQGKNGT